MANKATAEMSIAIIQALRFMENVWHQIDALRKTLEDQAKNAGQLKTLGIKISNYKALAGWETDNSDWVSRSVLDTFEVHKVGRKGRPVPDLHGAFQISLAPRDSSADEAFFPHVAILLANSKCDPWKCEEFQLDEQYLTTKSEPEDELWVQDKSDPARWMVKNGIYYFMARVVPLLDLRNDQDAREKVIVPLFKDVEAMIRVADSSNG